MTVCHTPRARRGFTLIECLTTLAIVGLLAVAAMPWYADHLRRGHRTNACTTLLQAAHWLERAASASGSYPQAAVIPTGILRLEGSRRAEVSTDAGTVTVAGDRYSITAASQGGQAYTLVATPMAGSAQRTDGCGSLTLDQAGRRGVRDARHAAADCWQR